MSHLGHFDLDIPKAIKEQLLAALGGLKPDTLEPPPQTM